MRTYYLLETTNNDRFDETQVFTFNSKERAIDAVVDAMRDHETKVDSIYRVDTLRGLMNRCEISIGRDNFVLKVVGENE